MALFENFPYTNLHELNLDWVIKEIEDLKEGQVLSVNGQTGVVILYQDNDILFPAVTDSHWSMVRSADGTTRGIMFGNDDKAYIVHGSTMEQIYSASNQPPYPVESVNGKTGVINLFTDNNGVVSFPAITDPDIEGIIIGRTLNNTPVYIQLNDDGTLGFTSGVNSNEIYTTKHTENNIIPIEEADTTEAGTNNKQWGIVREVNSGDIGLLFNLGETPEVYIRYRDAGLNWQNVKLLTNDDIPTSSGVVSFNGQTGAVTADATNLEMGNDDTRTIAEAIDDIIDDEYQIDNSITYTERGNTATQNIPLGKYVIWKNNPYVSIANISTGDTLSSSNLLALDHGIVNNLLNTVNNQADQINTLNSKIKPSNYVGDVNDMTYGQWYCDSDFNTNLPAVGHYIVDMMVYSQYTAFQVAYSTTTAQVFYRNRNLGTWGNWHNATSLEKVSASGTIASIASQSYASIDIDVPLPQNRSTIFTIVPRYTSAALPIAGAYQITGAPTGYARITVGVFNPEPITISNEVVTVDVIFQ